MDIQNEGQINALTVKALRESKKLNQKQFWGSVCLSGARGCAYETGRTTPIPPEVQRLVYLHHVVGFPTDVVSKEMKELADFVNPARRARREKDLAADFIGQAQELLNRAKAAIAE